MVDYQFLGLFAVALAVTTRGAVVPVVAATAVAALLMAAYEAGARRYRRRLDGPPGSAPPAEGEIARWMSVVDRVLRSPD